MEAFLETALARPSSPASIAPVDMPPHAQIHRSSSLHAPIPGNEPKAYLLEQYVQSEMYHSHPDYYLAAPQASLAPAVEESYWASLPSSISNGSFFSDVYGHSQTPSTSPNSITSDFNWPMDQQSCQQYYSPTSDWGRFAGESPASQQSSSSPFSEEVGEDTHPAFSSLMPDSFNVSSVGDSGKDVSSVNTPERRSSSPGKIEISQDADDEASPVDQEPVFDASLATNFQVRHTDNATSKETQFLRRRCFNCHTTEPPSWRRSTLNPGKIVCNKCGLYERTHLRPRPHRFDELRGGPKARKSVAKSTALPIRGRAPYALTHELSRRASVASLSSSNGELEDMYSPVSSSPLYSPSSGSVSESGRYHPTSVHRHLKPRSSLSSFTAFSPSVADQPAQSLHREPTRATLDQLYRCQLPVETGWQTIPLHHVRGKTKSVEKAV
ncbi:hypothetical protein FRC02_004947 [Tulasnella sp. 418]|nr:hypothetical protein FRC02_004947 [Tulasnella sp. 418]